MFGGYDAKTLLLFFILTNCGLLLWLLLAKIYLMICSIQALLPFEIIGVYYLENSNSKTSFLAC